MRTTIRESSIEKTIVARAKARGWWSCKFTSPAMAGVPDRMFIRDGRVVYIEIKRPGNKPTPLQAKRMADMRTHGAEVHWVDSVEAADAILQ